MTETASKAVFLSYASQDAEAAKRICEALRAVGVEVWFDQNELVGGDAWDAKIRGQIGSCALFMPVISGNTQSRSEGYFRVEWRLAAQRTHAMADHVAFLVPVVIDDTTDAEAFVPEKFREVQWTRLRGGETGTTFSEHVQALLADGPASVSPRPAKALAPGGNRKPPVHSQRRWTLARFLAAGAVVVVALAAVWFSTLGQASRAQPAPAPATSAVAKVPPSAPDPKSVVVLPFANLSGDPAQEYFSDGLTEEILNALARERDLRVVPRTSAFSFKGKNLPLPEIARALNVAQVVEGSVRRAGNMVRIDCTLTRVSDGFVQPLPQFQREMKDASGIFALEDDVAHAVVQKLMRRETTVTVGGGTSNWEAYDRFLRARALQSSHATGPSGYEAMHEYEAVVRLDPTFGLAWAQLAEVASGLGTTSGGFDMSEATRARAEEAANQAVRLAPKLADAHVARAVVCLIIEQDIDGAARELHEADRLQPFNAGLARVRAMLEAPTASRSRLLELVKRAVELDPQNTNTLTAMGQLLWRRGDFAHADEFLRRATVVGESQNAFLTRGLNWAAWTGDIRQALAIVNGCPEPFRNELFYRVLAPLYEEDDNEAGAIATWEKARQMAEKEIQTPGIRSAHVLILTALGRHARKVNAPRAKRYFDQARRELDALLQEQPHTFNIQMRHVQWLAAQAKFSEALAALDTIESSAARPRFHAPGNLTGIAEGAATDTKARLLAALGKTDAAIDQLKQMQAGGSAFGYALRLTREFKSLRNAPAFQAMMRDAEARADAMPHPPE